jgi:hypothetical protein
MSVLENAISAYDLLRERRLDVPERFSSHGKISVKTADIDPVEIFEKSKKFSKFPLFRLYVGNRTYRATKPIIIHIYQEDEWYFAENETLVLTGTGTSIVEAIHDLEQHIVHFWNYYKQLPDTKLTGDALRLKQIYSDLLIEDKAEK